LPYIIPYHVLQPFNAVTGVPQHCRLAAAKFATAKAVIDAIRVMGWTITATKCKYNQ